jgi:flagellar basal-body rod modification protein FlgD
MSNPINKITNLSQGAANKSLNEQKPQGPKSSNGQTISQNDFLQLLVTQLQNQDPLNPMENEEFAVQLATFSQLEQLIQINDKIGVNQGGMPPGSLASYLGHEVALPDGKLQVSGGVPSNLYANVPAGTESVRVDIRDASGQVVGSTMIEPVPSSGMQVLSLDGLELKDGKYDFRVVSVGSGGRFVELNAQATGTVDGFVMEPEPRLLVGGQEFSLDEVRAVFNGQKKS